MPQLDYTLLFNQIFWLFLVLIYLYIICLYFFLPLIFKLVISRKRLITENYNDIKNFKKDIYKLRSFYKVQILKINLLISKTTPLIKFFNQYEEKTLKLKLLPSLMLSSFSYRILYCDTIKKS